MSERGVILLHDTQIKTEKFGVWQLMEQIKDRYLSMEFRHGNGLGIVCTGSMVNDDFLKFIKNAKDDTFIHNLFENLGKKVLFGQLNDRLAIELNHLKQALNANENELIQQKKLAAIKENEIIRAESEIKALHKKIQEKDHLITKHINETENNRNEMNKLLETINDLNLVTSKLIHSFSWRITKPLRLLKRYLKKFNYSLFKNIRKIQKSGLFDEKYYLQCNPDVWSAKINPVKHYLLYGGYEGRNPSPDFDSAGYLRDHDDVRASRMNPLLHYILFGHEEGRQTISHSDAISENKKADINIIGQSGLFDGDYYLRTNTDVKAAGIDPLDHFYKYGGQEGRNPSTHFDTFYYHISNPDVKKSGINPLVHYLRFGKKEGRLTKPLVIDDDKYIKLADISDLDRIEENIGNLKIAVLCHLFHLDLADEFIGYFNHIPVPFDLFITTTFGQELTIKKLFEGKIPNATIKVVPFKNKGRDIKPFFELLSANLLTYDLVCKVHSKKSDYNYNLLQWRKYLLDQLLGNTLIVRRIISEFKRNKQLGLVWPVAFPYLMYLGMDKGWGSHWSKEKNHQFASKYFSEFRIDDFGEDFAFPAGSMFWFRPTALESLTEKTVELNFDNENYQIDGTLAHAMERLFGLIGRYAGYENKTVYFRQEFTRAIEKKHNWLQGSKSILFVAHDLYQAGAQIVLLTTLEWMKKHTAINLFVLALKKGTDGGKLLQAYHQVSKVFIWDEYRIHHDEDAAIEMIQKDIGKIDLIYGNTIVVAALYKLLSIFNAPYVTHIHELEQSIQKYTSRETRNQMIQFTSQFIADSRPVMENLIENHAVPMAQVIQVDEFIHTGSDKKIDRTVQRMLLNIPADKVIIWGCGTIYWRKGTDLFIETAKKLKDRGLTNFHFYWIGENHWNTDSEEFGTWKDWEQYILINELTTYITFLGAKDNPKKYFNAGDIFFLSSREEPFGIVCLEAAEGGSPIICFDEAGGMPGFVGKDAGVIVRFLDVNEAADAIENLIKNEKMRLEMGLKARANLFQNHSDDIAVPRILQICHSAMGSAPLVSVIVPVYNHEQFLKERIESILYQTFRDFEVIILDDASTDKSYEIAKSYEWHPAINVYRNETNSGSPFRQWQKGTGLARGKFIWIAEGDDKSSSVFLESLLPTFNDPEVTLAYCASHRIDASGEIQDQFYLKAGHYDNLNYPRERWQNDYIVSGCDEVNNALAIRCTIPNVSAVIFKSDSLKEFDFTEPTNFKTAGDWFAYVTILKKGKISYNALPLNYHRIHSNSVVAINKRKAIDTLPDYFCIHKLIITQFNISDHVFHLMISSVANGLRSLWPDISDKEFSQYYDVSNLEHLFVEQKNNGEKQTHWIDDNINS
jgi:glycosyltransferase involved in cell wall biosynthesis